MVNVSGIGWLGRGTDDPIKARWPKVESSRTPAREPTPRTNKGEQKKPWAGNGRERTKPSGRQEPFANILGGCQTLQRPEQFVVAVRTDEGAGRDPNPVHELAHAPLAQVRE